MRKNPWFWGTFCFWMFLAGTATAWAFIWGPGRQVGTKVGGFHSIVQGCVVTAELFESQGTIEEARQALTQEWTKNGWVQLGHDQDLIALWLGCGPEEPAFTQAIGHFASITVFERQGGHRLLGLLQAGSSSLYLLQSEIPHSVIPNQSSPDSADRPHGLPEEVDSAYESKCGSFEVKVWTTQQLVGDETWFKKWCSTRSIRLSPGRTQGLDRIYWAQEKSRIWVIRQTPEIFGSSLSWASLR